MNRLRVLVADDHPVVRAGLEGMLTSQADFEMVGEAINGQEAVEKEAARSLSISEATIKSHLLRIFNKVGVEDRTAAVTVALERNLLRLDRDSLHK